MKNEPGTYIIVLKYDYLNKVIPIGKNKELLLAQGFYYYVGSAFGPGGVKARVNHHIRTTEKPHWHLDFLRKHTQIIAIWYTHDKKKREHQWAKVFNENPLTSIPLEGFGSSDCKCESHLVYCNTAIKFANFSNKVNNLFPKHMPIYNYELG